MCVSLCVRIPFSIPTDRPSLRRTNSCTTDWQNWHPATITSEDWYMMCELAGLLVIVRSMRMHASCVCMHVCQYPPIPCSLLSIALRISFAMPPPPSPHLHGSHISTPYPTLCSARLREQMNALKMPCIPHLGQFVRRVD